MKRTSPDYVQKCNWLTFNPKMPISRFLLRTRVILLEDRQLCGQGQLARRVTNKYLLWRIRDNPVLGGNVPVGQIAPGEGSSPLHFLARSNGDTVELAKNLLGIIMATERDIQLGHLITDNGASVCDCGGDLVEILKETRVAARVTAGGEAFLGGSVGRAFWQVLMGRHAVVRVARRGAQIGRVQPWVEVLADTFDALREEVLGNIAGLTEDRSFFSLPGGWVVGLCRERCHL